MKSLSAMICLCLLLSLGAPARGEDLQPPPWRGEWSTTSQVWKFLEPVSPGIPLPPDGPAAGGMPPLPSTQLIWEPGPAPWDEWLPVDPPDQPGTFVGLGVIPLSGRIDVIVDNHDPWKPKKLIWVQLTWRPQDQGEEPIFMNIDPQPVEPPIIIEEILLGDPALGWRETTYFWELPFNPPDEMFVIEAMINVDEIVIDTWCIPEPAALSLLGLGGLALIRRRRFNRTHHRRN